MAAAEFDPLPASEPRFADIGGARIEYRRIEVAGARAPAIVFLHEGLGSVSQWRDFPAQLCALAGLDGLVYSRRGHGRSAPLAAPRTPDFMHAEALQVLPQLLATLDVKTPILFGHSDGASIAAIYAGAHPAAVRALILEAPHFFVEARSLEGIRAARAAFETTDLPERLARHHDDARAMFYGWNDVWLSAGFRDWNIESALGPVRCPVLAIQGEDDEYGTMAQLDALERRAGGAATLLKLARCGHVPHRDQRDAVLAACARFIATLDFSDPISPR
ncbi:MAG TPA: alpha/beta hydrolase [Burkholderiales bacterium]|nr:alpha/beta hydrolase [Burkholderiales bacterium]